MYHDGAVQREYPYTNTLLQAILKARPRPVTPCYHQFTEELQVAVTEALIENRPIPESFIDTLETALRC